MFHLMELFKAITVLRLSTFYVHYRGNFLGIFLFIVYTLMNFHRVNPFMQLTSRSGNRTLTAYQNPPCALPAITTPTVATILMSNSTAQLCRIFTLNKGNHTFIFTEAGFSCSFSVFMWLG